MAPGCLYWPGAASKSRRSDRPIAVSMWRGARISVNDLPASPVKPVIAVVGEHRQQGEFNITASGIEGGLIYAMSAPLRDALERDGRAALSLDLAPGRSLARLTAISPCRAAAIVWQSSASAGRHRRRQGRSAARTVPAGNPQRCAGPGRRPQGFALACCRHPATRRGHQHGGWRVFHRPRRASLMLKELPGVFCAGEMLDWEAPTGGYLLTAVWLVDGRPEKACSTGWRAEILVRTGHWYMSQWREMR